MFEQEISIPHHLAAPNPDYFDLDLDQAASKQCPFCGEERQESEMIPCLDCGERLCPSCNDDARWHRCCAN